MNIFEDLIDELKEENLLEETVIELHKEKIAAEKLRAARNAVETSQLNETLAESGGSANLDTGFSAKEDTVLDEEKIYTRQELETSEDAILVTNNEVYADSATIFNEVEKVKMVVSEKEYFRKRATDEVSGLQTVEHVLSGIEREQMKAIPKSYDDLPVKMALHDFLQDTHNTNTTEHAQAEFRLMQETESWYSALSHRDKQITVSHLRRFCETARPALSAQALISLARFYRNSPYSEPVRSKYDLIITRLFSREIEFDQRELLLTREEMTEHIRELYADWSSIQLYSVDDADSQILISTLKFDDFINEVESATNFDELIKNDFFNRLRLFKEECRENFFAPIVSAIAIESNVRVGNRFVNLLQKEKENSNTAGMEEKYGFLHDQTISDAAGKTFQLVELLKEKSELREAAEIVEVSVKEQERSIPIETVEISQNKFFAVNKWLLGSTILIVLLCISLYFWADYETKETNKVSPGVIKVNLENSELKEYIQTARINEETFFGITMAAWAGLNSEKKEELLKKILSIGPEKGYKKVHLINENGKSVGFASDEKVEIYHQ